MNINYSEIIEKANARTEKLKQLQVLLHPTNLQDMLTVASSLEVAMTRISDLSKSLDAEALGLLPEAYRVAMQRLAPRSELADITARLSALVALAQQGAQHAD